MNVQARQWFCHYLSISCLVHNMNLTVNQREREGKPGRNIYVCCCFDTAILCFLCRGSASRLGAEVFWRQEEGQEGWRGRGRGWWGGGIGGLANTGSSGTCENHPDLQAICFWPSEKDDPDVMIGSFLVRENVYNLVLVCLILVTWV